MADVIKDDAVNASYIRGYAAAISTLFDKRGGQKVAALMYSFEEMRKAGVTDEGLRRINAWLSKP